MKIFIITAIALIALVGVVAYLEISGRIDLFSVSNDGEINKPRDETNQGKPNSSDEQPPEDQNNDGNGDQITPPATALPEIVYGNRTKKQVIFTFDAGAGTHSADEILLVLNKHNIKGTFFITGKWAEQNPSLIKSISDSGHEIFNHTYSHPNLTQLSDSQISEEFRKADEIIKGITGLTTKPYFRPPYGDRNKRVLDAAAQSGYRSIYWTVDALDWKEGISEAEVKARIMNNLQQGTIYMMHVGDDITGSVLDEIFTQINAQGYQINSLTEGLK